ncbi:U6 snRNA phosphodiesterase 1 isoform X2 [Amia ocellicauda]|uniref:U6 snRNA phosphodiesterase 1 isoform X2 n=1 Tax=Amia ocellicauda TaxID=2972642 RepID=UPI0034644F7F
MLVGYSSSSEDENENVGSEKRKIGSLQNDATLPDCKRHKCSGPLNKFLGKRDDLSSHTCRSRLPVPGSVLDMFKESGKDSLEDPSKHEGRIRSFSHERGNWATYVYLPYMPDEGFVELAEKLTGTAGARGVALIRAEEFHISLSQTVVLRHHWIEPFVVSLKTDLANCQKFVCVAERLNVYTNQEKNRTFLGLEVTTGHSQLLEVVSNIDRTMREFSLSTFYEKPSFHLSLAWCVGDHTEELTRMCSQELQSLLDDYEDSPFLLRVPCEEIRCKSGNKIFSFPMH